MTDRPDKPTLTEAGKQARDERRSRQAEALRANLARRKARDRSLRQAAETDRDKACGDKSGPVLRDAPSPHPEEAPILESTGAVSKDRGRGSSG